MTMLTDTELRLSFWRDGSTKAERLAAAALQLSGYEEIDPQSPLGGPDGRKDILCLKGGRSWCCAVYFPIGPVGFSAVRRKFVSDLQGASAAFNGFVFVTNQNITPKQRHSLSMLANAANKEFDILHLQQIQILLDSPPGYGIRIQFLGIGMTIEEQLSWASNSDTETAKAVAANTRELLALRAFVERMDANQARAIGKLDSDQSNMMRTLDILSATSAPTPDLIASSTFSKNDRLDLLTASMSPQMILLFHRLICFDLPSRSVGKLRTQEAWLGSSDGTRNSDVELTPPGQIVGELSRLCTGWVSQMVSARTNDSKLKIIADFHSKFLVIHPFLDGNGRVARALMMQQCLDLFGIADMSLLNKGAEYYSALKAANTQDLRKLMAVLRPVVGLQ